MPAPELYTWQWFDSAVKSEDIKMPAPGPDPHKDCRERIADLKRQLDVANSLEACSSCGGAGVVYEYGDYGAVYGVDECDQCEAGRTIAVVVELLYEALERTAKLERALTHFYDTNGQDTARHPGYWRRLIDRLTRSKTDASPRI